MRTATILPLVSLLFLVSLRLNETIWRGNTPMRERPVQQGFLPGQQSDLIGDFIDVSTGSSPVSPLYQPPFWTLTLMPYFLALASSSHSMLSGMAPVRKAMVL